VKLHFFGAAETVTGSRYLVEDGGACLLVDCGLFQGLKKLRLRNREPFPVPPREVDTVLLTHAHIDHTGYLPAFVRDGFRGEVLCTEATRELCQILLPDAASIQEEEARYANRKGYSKHSPALPLYTAEDAHRALERLRPVVFGEEVALPGGFQARWGRAGHILGAAWIRVQGPGGGSILFSGDIGPPEMPVVVAPAPPPAADALVLESTYGDRLHSANNAAEQLAGHVRRTVERGGVVVIPAFAVGRAQTLIHLLARAFHSGTIPQVPIFLDSPMAGDVTRMLVHHREEHRLTDGELAEMSRVCLITNSVDDSKAINIHRGPKVVVSASGMATGGRVLHHLRAYLPDPRNLVLFSGYQAAGTRGAALLHGADSVKIHGNYVPVKAEVTALDALSAHADYRQLLEWASAMPSPPRHTWLTHGEPEPADALRRRIGEELGWEVSVPEHMQAAEVPG